MLHARWTRNTSGQLVSTWNLNTVPFFCEDAVTSTRARTPAVSFLQAPFLQLCRRTVRDASGLMHAAIRHH